MSPQTCLEGAYCEWASSTAGGTGPCHKGHFCPPGFGVPIQSPVGTFTGHLGFVTPILCFPGTYAPLKNTVVCRLCPAGYTCQGYGTYIPTVCPAGTYHTGRWRTT